MTIVPVPLSAPADAATIARSRWWFPVLGLPIGMAVGLAGAAAQQAFGNGLVAGAAAVTAWAVITGALHLDGLADCFDGLFARGDAERRLAVMHDPHLGTFGVVALILCLLLKTAAVSSLEAAVIVPAIAGAAVAGRGAILVVAGLCPYARSDGTGKVVIEAAGWRDAVWAAVCMIGLTAASACARVFGAHAVPWAAWLRWFAILPGSPADMRAMLAVLLGAAAWAALCRRRLGGATGDCLGAACELGELLYLLVRAVDLEPATKLVSRLVSQDM